LNWKELNDEGRKCGIEEFEGVRLGEKNAMNGLENGILKWKKRKGVLKEKRNERIKKSGEWNNRKSEAGTNAKTEMDVVKSNEKLDGSA
jgi:hypothetical protein